MRTAPLKRRHQNSGRAAEARCCSAHLAWVRGHQCAVPGCKPDEADPRTSRIEAAHVRIGTDGGMGLKPSDAWAIPLCAAHHARQHLVGEETFSAETGLDMWSAAAALAARSPHLRKLEQQRA